MSQINLYRDEERSDRLEMVSLGQTQMGVNEDFLEGDSIRLFGRNDSKVTIKDLVVAVAGDDKPSVQLAVDRDGEPGVWTAPGESIFLAEFLGPKEQFSFWARATYTMEDRVGDREFEFSLQGIAIG